MYERGVFCRAFFFFPILALSLSPSLYLFRSLSFDLSVSLRFRSYSPDLSVLYLLSRYLRIRTINSLITFFFATPLLLVRLSVFLRSSAPLLLLCSSYSASSALSSLPLLRGNLSLQRVSRSKLQAKKRKYIFTLFDVTHDERSTSTLEFFQCHRQLFHTFLFTNRDSNVNETSSKVFAHSKAVTIFTVTLGNIKIIDPR